MGDSQTLFEKISKSERIMAEFMADHVIDSPCDMVCGGECHAIAGFHMSRKEMCVQKIMQYLSMPAVGDDVIE